MWTAQMLDGIKQNKNRMEIAAEIGVNVYNISHEALMMIDSCDYRSAGITDEQFAYWFEASLIGLRTDDNELVIKRTEPSQERINSVLKQIKSKRLPEVCLKPTKPLPVGYKNCWLCKRRGSFLCNSFKNYDDGSYAVVCKYYRR